MGKKLNYIAIIFLHALIITSCFGYRPEQVGIIHDNTFELRQEGCTGEILLSWGKDSVARVYISNQILSLLFNKNDYVIELYDLTTLRKIKPLVKYGKVEGEMLMVDYSAGSGTVILYDFVKNIITSIDINRAASQNDYKPVFRNQRVMTQERIPFEEGKLLCLNPYSYKDSEPRFIITDDNGDYIFKKHNYDSFNVVDGTLLYNKENETIAFLSLYSPYIEFSHLKSNEIERLAIPRTEEINVKGIKNGKITEYYFLNHVPLCFVGGDSNDDYIIGAYLDEDKNSYLVITDWQGHQVKSFRIEGRVNSVSITDSGEFAYCLSTIGEKTLLIKYEL